MYRNVQNKFFKISLILATGSGSNPDPDPQPWFSGTFSILSGEDYDEPTRG
jgi:hypothetical protein